MANICYGCSYLTKRGNEWEPYKKKEFCNYSNKFITEDIFCQKKEEEREAQKDYIRQKTKASCYSLLNPLFLVIKEKNKVLPTFVRMNIVNKIYENGENNNMAIIFQNGEGMAIKNVEYIRTMFASEIDINF